ncbi:hypothetical protein [Methylomonas fluvii]|uniref:Uncharacterized protein n=1 Tax=Methylomonas fluvii TaxID=1854564 RepID=A0ABR9DLR5_9GAMM|nr:hypothetical protein [Methylomonas fluvii]MBD9363174.1 hypothetical protein [Methylomonas fluvii]
MEKRINALAAEAMIGSKADSLGAIVYFEFFTSITGITQTSAIGEIVKSGV